MILQHNWDLVRMFILDIGNVKDLYTHQNLPKSLQSINNQSHIINTKNTVLIVPSILKYFFGGSANTFWIITHSNLPPSSAGIGKTLNIASDKDIIPANIINWIHQACCIIFWPILIAHAGQVNQSRLDWSFSFHWNIEINSLPRALRLSLNCQTTSWKPYFIESIRQ